MRHLADEIKGGTTETKEKWNDQRQVLCLGLHALGVERLGALVERAVLVADPRQPLLGRDEAVLGHGARPEEAFLQALSERAVHVLVQHIRKVAHSALHHLFHRVQTLT